MRIGYAGRNLTLNLPMPPSLRPDTYTPERFVDVVDANLTAIETTLLWNIAHGIRYYRLNPWTIPFASHPVVTVPWQEVFAPRLSELGNLIRTEAIRVTVHPGQYLLLNSPDAAVVDRGVTELAYHAELFDLMGVDSTHRIQIHTGGVFEDKDAAIERFVRGWDALPAPVRARLAIENDERLFSLTDNLRIHAETGIPLVFDAFHHSLFNEGESLAEALDRVMPTWAGVGPAMIDYSTQDDAKGPGAHAATIDLDHFATVYPELAARDVDVMFEIKDKEFTQSRQRP
jgi:UV DNA damage endonuclease